MKNKENIIGWVLIATLFIGFWFYQSKKLAEEQAFKAEKEKTEQTLAAKAKPTKSNSASSAVIGTSSNEVQDTTVTNDSTVAPESLGLFAKANSAEEKVVTIENEVLKLNVSSMGAQLKSVELKAYKTWDKKPLILFTDKTNSLNYSFPIDNDNIVNTSELFFEPQSEGFKIEGKETKSLVLRATAGEGKFIEQKFTLSGNSYLIDYNFGLVGMNTIIPQNNTYISAQWQNQLSSLERNIELERRYSALYYRYNESDVKHLDEDNEKDEATFESPLEWISYKQQFFNTTLFSKGQFKAGKLETNFSKENNSYVKKYSANFTIPYTSTPETNYAFQYFIGPNHFNTLAAYDKSNEEVIKLGPNFWMFSWIKYITRFIIWVFSWFENMNLNYGIIILLMTLMLKLALHPLTAKSIESAAKMKILAPELAALKEKYGEDQTKMGQEQMKLYQRAGVSPLGGCLPLLLQMPILMAMYYFFPASVELRQEHFLWATDLSSYDSIVSWATPVLGMTHISLFTVLMTITSILQAVMNNQMNAMGNQQPGMKYIPYIMPLMLMFMFNSFPAALTYYYLLQNLLGIAHQWIIQKFFIDDEKLRKQIEENKKNPNAKKSGWMKKLEDMQRQAQQSQAQREK
jgi:YidC/Oxa1 family membrane protein insertase